MTVLGDSSLERARRLGAAVTRAQYSLADAIAARNAAVLEAADAGHSLGTLARALDLSRATVQAIVANTAARAGAHPGGLPSRPFDRN